MKFNFKCLLYHRNSILVITILLVNLATSSLATNRDLNKDTKISPIIPTTNDEQIEKELILLAQGRTKRVALVIGNSNYQNSSNLRNAVNDANDVAKSLRGLDFEVILLTNANFKNMDQGLETFYQKLQQGAVGLFYYAGHGVQVNGENYLVPIDAKLARESEVSYETVPLGKLLAAMRDVENDVNIIILDACRDNPFARSWTRSSNTNGLAPIQNSTTGSFIAYATGPGNVAQDGTGRNGTFTEALLRNLNNANQSVEDIFKKVRVEVAQKTNNTQVPWTTSSLIGDFYFVTTQNNQSVAHNNSAVSHTYNQNNQSVAHNNSSPSPPENDQSIKSQLDSIRSRVQSIEDQVSNSDHPPSSSSPQVAFNNRSNSPFQDLTGQALPARTIAILRSLIAGHNLKEATCGSSQHQVTITLNNRYLVCAQANSTYRGGEFSLTIPNLK